MLGVEALDNAQSQTSYLRACHARDPVWKEGCYRHLECKTMHSTEASKGQLRIKSGELGLELAARGR